jgi:dipeptidyl aminopeptidase/acylaminoacyl peptidase
MNIPKGKGPFPVLVLNHGYIDPDTYFPGQGMPREHDYLARHGYVVLHTDYRGHASSDNDPNADYELRLPYAVDTINAVRAVKSSKLPFLDRDRVGWLGRSMGGGVTLTALVAQPGLVDAAVIYASVSSLAADNWKQFYRPAEDRSKINKRIARTYGLPAESPEFWRAASPRPYFDRITEPLLVHHGTADDTCPIRWSDATVKALQAAGKDVTFIRYRGEGHSSSANGSAQLSGRWPSSTSTWINPPSHFRHIRARRAVERSARTRRHRELPGWLRRHQSRQGRARRVWRRRQCGGDY